MRLFLDSSVLLAACGSPRGASRALVKASREPVVLITSEWCLAEVERNLPGLGAGARRAWRRILPKLRVVRTEVVLDRPLAFGIAKDKPVLIGALAAGCETLLTLDQADFGKRLGRQVYGLRLMSPGEWLAGGGRD